ncbi:hypothetical protein AB0D66_18645 [Streptomyces sp. NPDC048270]|uniref:hypothetical protein n=1 Tax=Streptomyces sp. NPDC048270 TaxID=3154615 RepID=UPI0033F1C13B
MSTTLPAQRSVGEDPGGDSPVATRREYLQYAAAIGAVAALVLYGLQYWALERFYERFGITPEQAGIGKTEMLTRLAVWLGFVGFFAVLILPLMLALLELFTGMLVPRSVSEFVRHRLASHAWFRRGVLVLATASWLALTAMRTAEDHLLGLPTAFEFVIALFYAGAAVAVARHRSPRLRGVREIAITLALCVFALGYWLGNAMGEEADHVRASGHVGLMEQFVGVRLQPVCADLADVPGLTDERDFRGLSIGESGGVHTLYDITRQRVFRVPAAQARLWSPAPGGDTDTSTTWRQCGAGR